MKRVMGEDSILSSMLRKEEKQNLGDSFFKLMNNAFYGKTIENVYDREDVEIVNDDKR